MTSIFSLGMSGGGAQSAIIGASGDSAMYDDYLLAIGAVTGVSDAVKGSMCWCPITNLDVADEAYEWNLGNTRTTLTEEEQLYSDEMAEEFANYMNSLKITDEEGHILTLETSEEGIYQAGSYYDYLVSLVETSLNNFLADTQFPYTTEANSRGATGGGAPTGMKDGERPTGDKPNTELPDKETDTENGETNFEGLDNVNRSSGETAAVTLSGTYETVTDYIAALNEPYTWVSYDEGSNTATITSLSDFTTALKVANKGIAAFDQLDASQGENTLFGYGDGVGAHFDVILANLIRGTEYEEAFTTDLSTEDAQGNTVDYRVAMYNPMYYLSDYYDGYQTSNVATYWRIRTGITQGDTSLNTEANLALALGSYSEETQVDFETVWGLAHTTAERTDDYVENFITWVNENMEK